TDDSQAFNDAISAGVKRVYIPRGTYAISKAKLRDNLEIIGEPGTVIRQLNNTEYYQNGTFEYRDTSGASRANVTIRNIEFISYPYNTNALNNAILFLVDLNTRVSNIIIDNCTFRAQQQTAIFFLNRFQDYIGIKNVMVNNCRAYGDTTLSAQSKNTNLVRTLSNFSPILGSYGKVGIENITVRGCYSEYIRTLADIKRGVRGATILGNVARNSYDVAYSSDGCFQVSIANNVADNDSLFLSKITAGGSQIEVQGEGVSITNNIITYCKANGILITDYGLPEEGGLGHNSKGVVISGNTVKFSDIAIKAVNAIGMNISGNQVDYAKTRSIAVDNGTGRVDGSGQPLKSKGVTVIGNLISNVGSIVVSSDSSAAASNFNTFGAATVDGSSTTLIKSPNTSQQILDAVKTVDGTGSGLDADLLDGVNSTGFYGAAGTFTDFNTATGNKIYTLSAITPANRPASGNYFSLLNIDQDVSGNSRAQQTFRIGTNDVLVRNQFGGTWSSWNLLYHSGNSNLSTVPWAASTVTASGAVSMPYTTISANTTLDATYRTVNTAT
ncbi:hypothetical protein, partial [Chitinophaga sp.]|uniref:hypothetical protein n=1 Tax=Chitinophaga sp. TaxID=1869181 RepID=UPI002B79B61C